MGRGSARMGLPGLVAEVETRQEYRPRGQTQSKLDRGYPDRSQGGQRRGQEPEAVETSEQLKGIEAAEEEAPQGEATEHGRTGGEIAEQPQRGIVGRNEVIEVVNLGFEHADPIGPQPRGCQGRQGRVGGQKAHPLADPLDRRQRTLEGRSSSGHHDRSPRVQGIDAAGSRQQRQVGEEIPEPQSGHLDEGDPVLPVQPQLLLEGLLNPPVRVRFQPATAAQCDSGDPAKPPGSQGLQDACGLNQVIEADNTQSFASGQRCSAGCENSHERRVDLNAQNVAAFREPREQLLKAVAQAEGRDVYQSPGCKRGFRGQSPGTGQGIAGGVEVPAFVSDGEAPARFLKPGLLIAHRDVKMYW